MDLGCIDMGCLEKKNNDSSHPKLLLKQKKVTREAVQPCVGALNKFTSQIKKPPHRKGSPIHWFPRKKVDSYLKRKIKLLQEVGGMNSTLDETLGDSNPHYSKVLKEKMAVREAAHKAMETRKAAMVEASWCRILQAARIHSKDAEALRLEAEKTASEAFEAAKSIGVIMYDMPDCPQNQYEIENTLLNGRLATHSETASFETAFEVDKQVGAAVKTAFIKLANCPSINIEDFKELLRKISENPATGGEDFQDIHEISSEYESDSESELETGPNCETEFKPMKNIKQQVFKKFNTAKLVDMMLERLRHLQEDELTSLATIVATSGLSAALAEAEIDKQPGSSSLTDHHTSSSSLHNHPRRVSSIGVFRSKKNEPELPSLDKFLVKRLTRLEKEIQEAKNARMKGSEDGIKENLENTNGMKEKSLSSAESASDLGSVLVKHISKFEKEMEEAKRIGINPYQTNGRILDRMQNKGETPDAIDVPLDKFLVRHLSKLERVVQEAKNKRNLERNAYDMAASVTQAQVQKETSLCSDGKPVDKENIDLNTKGREEVEIGDGTVRTKSPDLKFAKNGSKERETCSLDEILVKPVHREWDKIQASSLGNEYVFQHYQNRHKDARVEEWESLDKLLVKRVSRLEKEKTDMDSQEPLVKVMRKEFGSQAEWGNDGECSLDQILVKHTSRLEKEKVAFAEKSDKDKHLMSRRQMRERELQEAWGGLSLGNTIRPHLSRLQRDKAAWLKAEEEEKRKYMEKEEDI